MPREVPSEGQGQDFFDMDAMERFADEQEADQQRREKEGPTASDDEAWDHTDDEEEDGAAAAMKFDDYFAPMTKPVKFNEEGEDGYDDASPAAASSSSLTPHQQRQEKLRSKSRSLKTRPWRKRIGR